MTLTIPTSRQHASDNMEQLLSGTLDETTIYDYLAARPIDQATANELLGYYDIIWEKRRKAEFPKANLDIVGTGGVSTPRYNVSTTCCIILAALGINTAKHGNRGSKKKKKRLV